MTEDDGAGVARMPVRWQAATRSTPRRFQGAREGHEDHAAWAERPGTEGRGEGDERALWLDGDASGTRRARPEHADGVATM